MERAAALNLRHALSLPSHACRVFCHAWGEENNHTVTGGFNKTLRFTIRNEGVSDEKLHLFSKKIAFRLRFEQCRLARLIPSSFEMGAFLSHI